MLAFSEKLEAITKILDTMRDEFKELIRKEVSGGENQGAVGRAAISTGVAARTRNGIPSRWTGEQGG